MLAIGSVGMAIRGDSAMAWPLAQVKVFSASADLRKSYRSNLSDRPVRSWSTHTRNSPGRSRKYWTFAGCFPVHPRSSSTCCPIAALEGSCDSLEIVGHALARFIRVVHDDPRRVGSRLIDVLADIRRGTLGEAQRLR
jgi:hypothetical protein